MTNSVDQFPSLAHAFFAVAQNSPSGLVYSYATLEKDSSGKRIWRSRNFAEVAKRVSAIALYLQKLGVNPGDKVAILSNSRAEWMEADLAVLACGAVVVSIYQSLTAAEVGYILYDSGASTIFAENEEQITKLNELRQTKIKIPATEERPETQANVLVKNIVTFEPVSDKSAAYLEEILSNSSYADTFIPHPDLKPQNLASLVYTSGTTGAPKGVMQSHGNHLANVRQAKNARMFEVDSSIFLMLPLAHSFAKLMGYIGFLTPASLMFPAIANPKSSRPDAHSVGQDMREAGATVVPIVPRMLEKIQSRIEQRALEKSLRGLLVRLTLNSCKACQLAKKNKKTPSLKDSFVRFLTAPVRSTMTQLIFGKKFEYSISGGAKLPIAVSEFFDSVDIEILEGYGLTETCVATNVNRKGQKRIGTVGPLLDKDIELRIEADGEICFRGPNITSGYFGREAATRASWDNEGWFHTGDLGSVDAAGFLSITGRKKELIVTSGGKKIPPDPIEQEIKKLELISQAVIFGDDRNYLVALVTLNDETISAWAKAQGFSLSQNLHEEARVKLTIDEHFKKVNSGLASYETIKKFIIAPEDFTLENCLLTPTFKVKRKEVFKKYKAQIDTLYDG